MLCQILLVKADMREIQPAISADHCQFDAALLQRLSDARGNEALSRCIDPADSDKQGVLRQKRFSLLDNRRNHRTIFEHELQLRSVITAGSDLLAAKPVPQRAHEISTPKIDENVLLLSLTASLRIGCQKLGQPVLELNLASAL